MSERNLNKLGGLCRVVNDVADRASRSSNTI